MKINVEFKEITEKLNVNFDNLYILDKGGYEQGFQDGINNSLEKLTEIEVDPIKEKQIIEPIDNKIGFSKIVVNKIPDEYIIPEGKINITNTEEVDVTEYKIAQIVDENLKADNIAEGIEVLGITGSFKGGIDTSDGTITPDKVLKGEVGYAKENRVVGTIETYDYSNSDGAIPNEDYLNYLNGTFGDTYYAPEGATKLPTYMFYNNQNIEGLVCSSTISSLGGWVCRDAKKLRTVSLNDGLETIGQYAFYNCSALEEIVIPETVRTIELYCFNGCSNLNKVNVPEGITTINNYTFANCPNLKLLELPSTIRQINNYSLTFGNNGDATLIMKATTPPNITNVAIGTGIGKIIVPKGTLTAYQSATNWSAKADIMEEEI